MCLFHVVGIVNDGFSALKPCFEYHHMEGEYYTRCDRLHQEPLAKHTYFPYHRVRNLPALTPRPQIKFLSPRRARLTVQKPVRLRDLQAN